MKSIKKVLEIFFLSLSVFLVSSCGTDNISPTPIYTASPEQMDESPFSRAPCEPPCWQGLEVGKSSESDVRLVLPTLTFIDQDSIFFHNMDTLTLDEGGYAPGVEITANCMKSKKGCLVISVAEDVLTEIDILLNYEIRADKAIEHLGNPSYVGSEEIGVLTGRLCGVYLVWADSRLVLASILHHKSGARIDDCAIVYETGKVSPELVITEVNYLSDAALQRLLATGTGDFFEYSGLAPEQ